MFGFGERKNIVQEDKVVELVRQIDSKPMTDSRIIAEVFGKRHADTMRSIEDLPLEFRERNFASSSYQSLQNKTQPMYNITRDGMSMLVMGFTGAKAMEWKIKFIEAFNLMEKKLIEEPKETFRVPKTLKEALEMQLETLDRAEIAEAKVDALYLPDAQQLFTTTMLAKELKTTEARLRKQLILDEILFRKKNGAGMRTVKAGYEDLAEQSAYFTPDMKECGLAPQYTLKWNTKGREFIITKYKGKDWAA